MSQNSESSMDSQNPMTSESLPQQPQIKRGRGRPRKTQAVPERASLEPAGGLALGQKQRRLLNQTLTRSGVSNSDLPALFQDREIARSRKGKAGQIVVKSLSGVQRSNAAQLARRLEHDLSEGREDIIEKIQASGTQNQSLQRVAAILEARPDFSLARAIAEAGADVALVLDTFAKGALALKKMETVLGIYREMPHLMRDLARHAIDQEEDCEVCFGVGKVTAVAKGTHLTKQCPRCKGSGKKFVASPHKAMAVKELLEISEIKPKKTGLQLSVNQGVQVNAGTGGGDLLARMSKAADEVLYHQHQEVVEAEVVPSSDSREG